MQLIRQQFERFAREAVDRYAHLNAFRDWLNAAVSNYEVFLEDNWFDDKTTIEYTFRSLDTFDTLVFAEDTYLNSRDQKGVWHLGAYQRTDWTVEDPWAEIEAFITCNGAPRYREQPEI